jgi:ATP-dependent Lon protease
MTAVGTARSRLLPVLALRDVCLFPGASLAATLDRPASLAAAQLAERSGGHLLALAQRDPAGGPRDLHSIGTVALVRSIQPVSAHEHRVELDGVARARAETLVGVDLLIAEAVAIEEGEESDEGDEWGAAVEALARYLHAHAELRAFLEQRRRSTEAMSWVNLACQHLPITVTARQKLLEASAAGRCLKISRGLDALLRKEQA